MLAGAVALLAVLAGACTGGDTASDPTDDSVGEPGDAVETDRPSGRSELKPTIELAVTDWTGARLNASIAEQLIERRLGYPVEAVEVVDVGRMLSDIESGEIDVVLEIWPSSLEERDRQLLDSGRVETLGPLGVVGKIGWYVPRSLVQADPALAQWSGLADPEVARRFATPETGSRGRFLGTDPGYEQHDEEIIAGLDLPFEVVYSGSDAATAAEVEQAIAADRPILLYWWTPTAEITRFDLVEVELPERTADCVAAIDAGEPQRCDYPADQLLKIVWPGLETTAPDLHSFLTSFELTTNDQLLMIDQVENGGRSVEAVAADWIAGNSDRWENWLQ